MIENFFFFLIYFEKMETSMSANLCSSDRQPLEDTGSLRIMQVIEKISIRFAENYIYKPYI